MYIQRVQVNSLITLLVSVILCESYKVAVVEYQRVIHDGFEESITVNLERYLSIINETVIKSQNLDLIVFPESTLVFARVVHKKEEFLQFASKLPHDNITIPCLEPIEMTSLYVKELSCASRQHNVYVSVNIASKNSQDEIFNTNIVFDRQGRLVSKYSKMRPLGSELYISSGNSSEYFETDFGVTFSVFICFDIFFEEAFREPLHRKVDAFIFPNYWYSELPQLSSMQVQQMWSYLHDTVLIASGANYGISGTSGTGIYSGRNNTYTSYLSTKNNNKILIAEITPAAPSKPDAIKHTREIENFVWASKIPNMNIYTLKYNKPNTNIQRTLCDGEFCCEFNVNVNDTSGLVLSIYNGLQPFMAYTKLGIQLCTVLQCKDNDCFTMPKLWHFNKIFNRLEVKVKSPTDGANYYPNVALRDLYFLNVENYTFVENELQLKLTQPSIGIYTFGYFGRNYKEDELPVS